jgi:histidyl-tRNA synthetase
MRDFLPDEVRRREYVIGVIRQVYERFGFEPLETPAVENIETLLGKYGEEGNKLIFKILKRGEHEATGEADLALRYDLTVPLARVVAEYQAKLPRFFKRYQVQPVWRAERPARGRFREFYQCDVDALGSTSMVVETELCAAASEALLRLGFADFVIRLNHRQLLTGLLEVAGVPAPLHGEALVAVDKLDKIGTEGVTRELLARGLNADAAARLLEALGAVPDARGTAAPADNLARLASLSALVADHPQGRRGVDELQAIVALAERTPAAGRLRIDPSLARGLSYYTGAILEIAVPDLSGSVAGGGRYDNLVGMFLGRDVPACGLTLGLERLVLVMHERGMFPPSARSAPAEVLVTQFQDPDARKGGVPGGAAPSPTRVTAAMADAVALAQELRAAGLRVELFPEADKLGKQLGYASARGIPFAVVLGDEERARGEVAVRDMAAGAQTAVPRVDAGRWIGARLGKP